MLNQRKSQIGLRQTRWFLVVILLAIGALSGGQGFINAVKPAGSQDFQWSPSHYLLQHEDPYRLYLEHRSGALKNNPFPLSQVPNYPASALVFLWPLAALDLHTAKWIWAAANILMGIGCVALVARIFGINGILALGLLGLFFASTPGRNTVGNGQQGLFSLFFFLLAVHCQIQKRPVIGTLCLAACWLKYTITFPLSLIFIRREWRATLVAAAAVHVGLILFLSIWTGENPFKLLSGPLMVSETGVDSTMYDTIAMVNYFGGGSRFAGVALGIILLVAAAWLVAKSKARLTTNLTFLSFVSLVWSHHASYDYLVLVIPLAFAALHWKQKSIGSVDILVASSVLLIWFVSRILDAANEVFAPVGLIVFWGACVAVYAALAILFVTIHLEGRSQKAV